MSFSPRAEGASSIIAGMLVLAPVIACLAALAGEPSAPAQPAAAAPAPETAARPAPEVHPLTPTLSRREREDALPSLLGGATLPLGDSLVLFQAGFPLLGVAYLQGASGVDDFGAAAEMDWVGSELFVGGLWRHALYADGPAHVALRARAGLYADFGADYVYSWNRSDVGAQLAPGIAASLDAGGGLVTLAADLPLTWTFERGMGVLFAPHATVAYEAPLFADFTVGARVGGAYRAAGGGAPGGDVSVGRGVVELTALLTYKLF